MTSSNSNTSSGSVRVLLMGGKHDGRTMTVSKNCWRTSVWPEGIAYRPSGTERDGMQVWTIEGAPVPTMTPEERERFEDQR